MPARTSKTAPRNATAPRTPRLPKALLERVSTLRSAKERAAVLNAFGEARARLVAAGEKPSPASIELSARRLALRAYEERRGKGSDPAFDGLSKLPFERLYEQEGRYWDVATGEDRAAVGRATDSEVKTVEFRPGISTRVTGTNDSTFEAVSTAMRRLGGKLKGVDRLPQLHVSLLFSGHRNEDLTAPPANFDSTTWGMGSFPTETGPGPRMDLEAPELTEKTPLDAELLIGHELVHTQLTDAQLDAWAAQGVAFGEGDPTNTLDSSALPRGPITADFLRAKSDLKGLYAAINRYEDSATTAEYLIQHYRAVKADPQRFFEGPGKLPGKLRVLWELLFEPAAKPPE